MQPGRFIERLRNRSRAKGARDTGSARASQAVKTERHSAFDRADAARDQRNELERLRDEARYRRERLDLYRARLYGGRASSQAKLSELERASGGADARLKRAEAASQRPPT